MKVRGRFEVGLVVFPPLLKVKVKQLVSERRADIAVESKL